MLADLRRLVSDSGTVLVAVCNPFHLSTESTELWQKQLPTGFEYKDTFVYDKTIAASRNTRREVHRSVSTYRRAFINAGFHVDGVIELDGTDTGALLPSSDHLVFRLKPAPMDGPRVSLLVKTCVMEWRTIERQVRHLVEQLETPLRFAERVVVVDTYAGPFARQYDEPDPEAHQAAMETLLSDGVVDRVVYAPDDPAVIRATYRKWFGAESEETHSANGQQLFATLYGFDSCTGDYVLQVDSDLLVVRHDRGHDYLAEMVGRLSHGPEGAVRAFEHLPTLNPFPIRTRGPTVIGESRCAAACSTASGSRRCCRSPTNWRRAGSLWPGTGLSTGSSPQRITVPTVEATPGRPSSMCPTTARPIILEWMDIVDAVERGHVPGAQLGNVELTGSASDWAGPKRHEPFVFVICGRNVDPDRFKRCVESLVAQSVQDWGAVVVDDASSNGFGDYAETLLAPYGDRITLVRNGHRRGGMYNTWNAVINFCADPKTVIITLDADDALIGNHVLERVRAEYADGADATVGSMLRLDKEAFYHSELRQPPLVGQQRLAAPSDLQEATL